MKAYSFIADKKQAQILELAAGEHLLNITLNHTTGSKKVRIDMGEQSNSNIRELLSILATETIPDLINMIKEAEPNPTLNDITA